MKLNFIGDLIFGDQPVKFGYGYDSTHCSQGYADTFNNVFSALNDADFTIANFESIIKQRPSKMTISNWSMCCDNKIASELAKYVQIVNVANNHLMDYGKDVYDFTIDTLKKSGIKIIGEKETPYVILNDQIAILGVSYLKVRQTDLPYFYNPSTQEWNRVLDSLKEKKISRIILYVHWGSEFISHPTEKQVQILNELLNYPFEVIIGHHAHVLQDACIYHNIPVFFGLGNFVSDYWQKRARETMILKYDTSVLNQFSKIDCLISKDGMPQIVSKEHSYKLPVVEEIQITTNQEIYQERTRLRKEYMKEFIFHFYKIKNKISYFRWVLMRLAFIVKYKNIESKNPEIVYEKYKL